MKPVCLTREATVRLREISFAAGFRADVLISTNAMTCRGARAAIALATYPPIEKPIRTNFSGTALSTRSAIPAIELSWVRSPKLKYPTRSRSARIPAHKSSVHITPGNSTRFNTYASLSVQFIILDHSTPASRPAFMRSAVIAAFDTRWDILAAKFAIAGLQGL